MYRIELCSRTRPGCSASPEYIGFNNKTCVAGVPPVSKTYGNTVGPLLPGSKAATGWRTWSVDVVSKKADRTIVTIKNDFSQARCTDRYIDGYAEKKGACKGTVWADRVHMRTFPGNWTVKPAKGTDGKCFNIVDDEKPVGCLRYLSANSDCSERHLKLAKKDDGSGLQRWKFVRVGGQTLSPSPRGNSCVLTGPANCSGCCKSKFEKFDGSYLDDKSCVNVAQYPQCDFETVPTPQPSPPSPPPPPPPSPPSPPPPPPAPIPGPRIETYQDGQTRVTWGYIELSVKSFGGNTACSVESIVFTAVNKATAVSTSTAAYAVTNLQRLPVATVPLPAWTEYEVYAVGLCSSGASTARSNGLSVFSSWAAPVRR